MSRKSVTGTVTGFNEDKTECYFSLQEQGNDLGEGVYDTTKLKTILVGITDIESFLGVGTNLSTIVQSKEEGGGDEASSNSGKFEVVRVRPILGGMKTNRFPRTFARGISYDRRRYTIPGFGFSKQAIPTDEEKKDKVPGEMIAEIICELRKQISKWNGFPVHELLNVLCNREEFSHIQKNFSSQDELAEFLKSYPQYFVVGDDDYAVFTMRGFKTEDLHDYLATQKLRRKPKRREEAYELIETIDDCKAVVAELKEQVGKETPLVLSLGCKGVRLRNGGPMTLLKMSTMDGVAYIFDLLASDDKKEMFESGGLKEILEDEEIIKVTYDCRTEQKALYSQFDVVLRNVFDVSIAYTVISEQCHVTSRSAPKFRPARPKFSELCSIFGVRKPRNQRAFMEQMNSTKDFWATRPLTDEMLDFAIDDVLCLVPVIYRDLDRFISPLWWPLYETRVEETLQRSKKLEEDMGEDDEEGERDEEEEEEEVAQASA
ncbi:hypothetical protein BSL78_09095 [Apostichopus japonicus]|uniref:3'-5' exonuclease domain-containing protein n=2 Tax=Stichopus japonicus TaxID=307972 RepID=A0A2G8L1I5_STIJA|nr:hypothetical protein BSL78_09095 [Apostichopus japonicus]